ncbi:MAG: ATP-dependent RecD-like DNA helicase [Tissierellia bacterium]|nr:ATP-dependent RecD-like DNA helicase [Tissierellia bacterium]
MVINGIVERITFHNSINGFTVMVVKAEEDSFVAVGNITSIEVGEEVTMEGEWGFHNSYGEQFQFTHAEKTMPTSPEGVEAYLSSGLIPGIGKVMAKRIVETFGEETLEVLEKSPEKLLKVEGIGTKTFAKMSEALARHYGIRRIYLELSELGVSTNMAMKLFRFYGEEVVNIITANPYRMAEDVPGIGFKTADDLARKMGIEENNPIRYKAGLYYVLWDAIGQGHCYLPKELWLTKGASLLNVGIEELEAVFTDFQMDSRIVIRPYNDEICCFPSIYFQAENRVAQRLMELSNQKVEETWDSLRESIDELEREDGLDFAEEQRESIEESFKHGVFVITGGPGTGKTTALNAIIKIAHQLGMSCVLAAPTGRAAKRMSEATGQPASTIHRLLEYSYSAEQMMFMRDENNPLTADLLIIDEASMIDIILMDNLLRAIPDGSRLILVGDVDQLPSVGAGHVLADIINSPYIPGIRLKHIFRQAQESLIITNAHRINKGEMPLDGGSTGDFFFMNCSNQVEMAKTIVELVSKRLPNYYGVDSIKDIQVLTPMHKREVGVTRLNELLQASLNPKDDNRAFCHLQGVDYRVGDKVMALKNNYQRKWEMVDEELGLIEGEGVFNGDMGYVHSIDAENETLIMLMDDGRNVEYEYADADEFTLAYATTIHKSQGSEFPVIVMPIYYGPPMLMTRNLLYTGITRAKSLVVLIGSSSALELMVNNEHVEPRYTLLTEKLEQWREVHGMV